MDDLANDSLSFDEDEDWTASITDNGRILTEEDMKEKMKNVAKKHLKKIKTLQQNKRRQDTRIERLTRENRTLKEKLGVQAGCLDIVCEVLGEEIQKKFKGRQAMGILGGDSYPDRVKDLKSPAVTCGDSDDGGLISFGVKNDIIPAEKVEFAASGSLSHQTNSLSLQQSRPSSGFMLDQPNDFVGGLDHDVKMPENHQMNHLYCIEDITQQDSSSMFIC